MTVSDSSASASCRACDMPARCFRERQIFRDGGVHMIYSPDSYCDCCYDSDSESGGAGVREDLSGKSTWEVCWENYTGEPLDNYRRDEVHTYGPERIKVSAPD